MTTQTLSSNSEHIWKDIVTLSTNIQAQSCSKSDRLGLLQSLIQENFPIDKREFSVIYKYYGAEQPKFAICAGKAIDKEQIIKSPPFSSELKSITKCIKNPNEKLHYFKTELECNKAGFKGYKSVLLVPMQLNVDKTGKHVGVFIAHSKDKEYAYKNLSMPLSALSEYMAFYMKINLMERRNRRTNTLHNNLLRNKPKKECNFLEFIVKELKSWFIHDDIYILLVNSFNIEEYFLACNKGTLIEDFRLTPPIIKTKLKSILGNTTTILKQPNKEVLKLDTKNAIKKHGITNNCKSWLATRLKDNTGETIGYIVLQNGVSEHSYEKDEGEFIARVADILAQAWLELRHAQKQKELEWFTNILITERNINTRKIYEHIKISIKRLYGNQDFLMIQIQPDTWKLKTVINSFSDFNLDKEQLFSKKIKEHIKKSGSSKNINAKELTLEHPVHGKLLVTPMRLENRSIGCFILKAQHCGELTAKYIDKLSDLIALVLNKKHDIDRSSLLVEFGNRVNNLEPSKLSIESVISIAKDYISKAMYSENLYIALYDKNTGIISFPCILQNGKNWKEVKDRIIIKNQLGKTETIILTGKTLLHETKKESKAWYAHKNHKDYADNPLASWVGVPILTTEGVIGVIATYHFTEDYIYSENDLLFLQMLSSQISVLFKNLTLDKANLTLDKANSDLNKANSDLYKAQESIVEKESLLATSLIAQDITHRLHNALGSISINITEVKETIKDICKQSNKNSSSLNLNSINLKTNEILPKLTSSLDVVDNLLGEVQQVTYTEEQTISIKEITKKLINQMMVKNRFFGKIVLSENYPNTNLKVKAHYRNLANCLYEIIDNAGTALSTQLDLPIINEQLYLKIVITEQEQYVFIDIIDNGKAIPDSLKDTIFKKGVSNKDAGGYGLWRAKSLAHTLKGELELLKTDSNIKAFRLSLPIYIEEEKLLAIIIEDAPPWVDIISRWLTEENFQIKTASNLKDAIDLFDNLSAVPKVVFLDISLDLYDSNDLDGISLIDKIKKINA
ncbi:MAG: GAF domain-containing protein, partial [Pseudomonadota bacterium]